MEVGCRSFLEVGENQHNGVKHRDAVSTEPTVTNEIGGMVAVLESC